MLVFKKKTNDYTLIKWVLAAMSKDAARPNLCRIHVDDEWVVATDGRRLHRFKRNMLVQEIAPGQYKVESNTAQSVILSPLDDGLKFPDHNLVVPKDREFVFCGMYGGHRRGKEAAIANAALILMDLARRDGIQNQGVDVYFIADAVGNQKDKLLGITNVSLQTDIANPVLFQNDDATVQAVVMPILLR